MKNQMLEGKIIKSVEMLITLCGSIYPVITTSENEIYSLDEEIKKISKEKYNELKGILWRIVNI